MKNRSKFFYLFLVLSGLQHSASDEKFCFTSSFTKDVVFLVPFNPNYSLNSDGQRISSQRAGLLAVQTQWLPRKSYAESMDREHFPK